MATAATRKGANRNAFLVIARDLQDRIADGEIELGRYLPTERELQDRYDVSRSTIRRAIAHLVDMGWAHAVPSKGVVAGLGLKKPTTRRIAFVDASNTYVLRVIHRRLQTRLSELGFELVHFGGDKHTRFEEDMMRAVEQECAGIIVWPYRGFPDQEVIRQVCQSAAVVFLDHGLKGVQHDLVTFDHFEAGRLATSRLIENGCKSVGVTGMFDMLTTTHETFSGYMAAMFQHGLQPKPRDFVFIHTSGLDKSDTKSLEWRLSQEDRPDGFLVLQDDWVPKVIEVALRASIDIPVNLKLMTVGDDIEVTVNDIGLSTVALDWDAMLDMAIETLIAKIEDPARLPRTLTAPSRVVVRGLCGSPKGEWNTGVHEITTFHGKLPIRRKQYAYRTHWSVNVADYVTQGGGQSNHETSIYAH